MIKRREIKEQIDFILNSKFASKDELKQLVEWLKGLKDICKDVKTIDSYILQTLSKLKFIR
ncbi:MAG: hypothetical protein ACW980_22540 [Promethearchaeota archaeon]|jgi:hypothetical protein